MSLVSSITLIVTVIIIYYAMIKFFSILFRITGLPRDKASFQAASLLTNAGYTTSESEIVVSEKTRRRIATAAMLSGYFFSVVIVSLFINLFLSIDLSTFNAEFVHLIIGFGALIAFFLFLRIPFIEKFLGKTIDGVTVRAFKRASKENFISVLDTYGSDAVVNIYLYKVPEILEGKCVADSDLRKKYNVNILMYTRNGHNHYVSADTIFSNKDILIAFGPLANIRETFLLKGHEEKPEEHVGHKISSGNEITIMSNFGYQVMADIRLKTVPPVLAGKSLIESNIKDFFSINIIMVSRKDTPVKLSKDTVINKGDRVIAFGPYESIHTVFGEISEPQQTVEQKA
ncbi:MAG: TrkA C-terminal domain-containing protein [Spirochaetales bacterium]|nr:TrkA C-terminal domain-containing protein [Spirochaetales bacterium]